ncbi:DNA polymerase III subunit delta [Paremcibacter congregatus]|uniref:DNA-directed DNA polymerase n=1 Tax=Paremcibacter congregatus TaxID=2043170 RepID=A0A2G4YP34_9PROT|nr:DNA polymerase III subunit delta [Paremcibacter congregatus]PHZ84081.1 DNA polymerase III subunit delta [Paremcibacter congregatus]QDE25858.1 DNA polymerase III subunit delta [Paremcibacter congregatus]|tara:strand:- start:889 stop:1923 length:1035 start_codon:yes stop_codon:yes gene_type:complete
MKLNKNDANAQVRKLNPAYRAVLIYGRDEGLVRERAEKIAKQIAPDLRDPFLVANIEPGRLKDEPALLADEAAAISMMGGQRVIRVDGAGENVTAAAKSFLDDPIGDGLVIITAGSLKATAGLVKLFNKAKNAAAIACYEDDQGNLQSLILEVMGAHNLGLEPEAAIYLQHNLGGDRMVSRGELEKLALYMGPSEGGRRMVSLNDARACVGDSGTLTLDMIAEATTGGDLKTLDDTLFKAFNRGENAIPILRNVARRLQKLHLVRGSMDQGMGAEQAVMAVVYNKFSPEKKSLMAQLGKWSTSKLGNALDIVFEAEAECKITGLPAEAICARACLRIANAARMR